MPAAGTNEKMASAGHSLVGSAPFPDTQKPYDQIAPSVQQAGGVMSFAPGMAGYTSRPRHAATCNGRRHMTNFTPIYGLIGGALIGLASALLMALTGRIAGISGIFSGLMTRAGGDKDWRLAFIAGLIAAPLIGAIAGHPMPLPQMPGNWLLIILAGLLVGFGTRMGGGCTSGHGVCGIARLSARSIAATAIFMATAIVTVAVMRHGFGG